MNNRLYDHPLFKARPEFLDYEERVALAYARAKAVYQAWNLDIEDIVQCSSKFWDMQSDPILVRDAGACNILACHVNLFMGTLAPFASERPDLKPLLHSAHKFECYGNLLLSEVGHGLDISSLETTACRTDDGFILNTPNPGAAKFMPPTTPTGGLPKVAIVFARLLVEGRDCGIHPFVVPTSNGHQMCAGVVSRRLPPRSGTSPIDFAITTFNEVHLPYAAFLGTSLDCPRDSHALLLAYLSRIGVGTATLGVISVSSIKLIAYIGAEYSYRRHVQGKGVGRSPIISFRTQQLPVLFAVAVAYVTQAWWRKAIGLFMMHELDPRSRHGVGVILKATTCRFAIKYGREVGERLGAQGTFGHNLVSQLEMDTRGISVAEGDILVLCIRLFSELLIGRYTIPGPQHSDTLLARHSASIFARCQSLVQHFPKRHRDPKFNALILPQSELAITALGHALAYSAALEAGLPEPLLDLFEVAVINLDPAWYAVEAGVSDSERITKEDRAVQVALPHLRDYSRGLDVRPYVSAPIIDDSMWADWLGRLKPHSGNASQDVYQGELAAKL